MFNKNKSKWTPIHFYKPVASNDRRIIFARYDFKSGLYDFKTVKVVQDMYSSDTFNLSFDSKKILEELAKNNEAKDLK